MRVPVSLLRQYVAVSQDPTLLSDVLNARVSEVEHIRRFPSRAALASVRFVRLDRSAQSANAHTLWRTDADVGIVVADKYSVRAGERYAAVFAGGSLPDGTEVLAREVAGLPSKGMLVSEAHLGIGEDASRPLRVADAIGEDAFDALGCDDAVLEFDLEPNRPDLFSLAGMARDGAAIWGLGYCNRQTADLTALPAVGGLRVELRTSRARYYAACAVTGVQVRSSPQWLQNAVRKLGMRPINNVVDAANLVMMETGQPLHTFDADKLRSGAIVLRMAAAGEGITTLDGVRRELTDECLLVCDGESPIAVAGVMGDASSEVSEGTTRLIIEGACFDMAAVRRASRRLSLRTEASTRFEKGLPISGVVPAIARLVRLLEETAGARAEGLTVAGDAAPADHEIPLNRPALLSRLGMEIDPDGIDAILRGLGFAVSDDAVRVPERRPDVRIPQDLVEEIGRIHGYEHVRSEAPAVGLTSPRHNPVVAAAARVRRRLAGLGWDEVYLPVWIGEQEVRSFKLDSSGIIALLNPIADNLCYFRPTAWPALCEAAVQNRKELGSFAIYEVGKVYSRRADGSIDERANLAGIAVGRSVLDLRDALVELCRGQSADATVARCTHPHLHPGRAFRVGHHSYGGELHPRLVRELGFREAPVLFATDLQALAAYAPAAIRYVQPSKFPAVDLDLNVEVPARVEVGAVLSAVPSAPWLRESHCVDRYPIGDGARLTLAFRFGAPDRSLALEEAMASLEQVRASMRENGWSPT
jgi:phenylalanyl-tRNA synthetase beta chain